MLLRPLQVLEAAGTCSNPQPGRNVRHRQDHMDRDKQGTRQVLPGVGVTNSTSLNLSHHTNVSRVIKSMAIGISIVSHPTLWLEAGHWRTAKLCPDTC